MFLSYVLLIMRGCIARDLPFARGNYSGFGRLGSVVFLYRHGQTAH